MITYRCTRDCPIHKQCFILKLTEPLSTEIQVLQKCKAAHGNDIIISIGPKSKINN